VNEIEKSEEKINWSALEYEHKERGNDWFWALGIVVVAGSATSIIYENYFFALLLIIGALTMVMYTIKRPELVEYEINQKGLVIKKHLFPYESFKTFWVKAEVNPTLFVKTTRIFMPIIPVPINTENAEVIRQIMLSKNIMEEEIKEHPSEKIMDFLGF